MQASVDSRVVPAQIMKPTPACSARSTIPGISSGAYWSKCVWASANKVGLTSFEFVPLFPYLFILLEDFRVNIKAGHYIDIIRSKLVISLISTYKLYTLSI